MQMKTAVDRRLLLLLILAFALSATCYAFHVVNTAVRPRDALIWERVVANESVVFICSGFSMALCLVVVVQSKGALRKVAGIGLLLSLWIMISSWKVLSLLN